MRKLFSRGLNVKDGIKIGFKDGNAYIEGGDFPIRKFVDNQYGYISQYISWENASYIYAEKGQEETDHYLLKHALQEGKKLCVSFYTKDVQKISRVFNDGEKYDVFVREATSDEHKGFSYVHVARKGCLADYYDIDWIDDIYQNEGNRTGYLIALENTPLIDFFNGNCKSSEVEFSTYMDTSNPIEDNVLKEFGPSALIITGLLYGYPIETTMKALLYTFPNG